MKRKSYYPGTAGAMLPFLQNLCARAPNSTTQLGITGPEQSFLNLMCDLWQALSDLQTRAKHFAEEWTSLREACSDGPVNSPAPAWPVWTGPATSPVGLTTGCGAKLRAIIRRWKSAPGYTAALGEDLGIVGTEISVNPETAQPELRVAFVAGQPQITASPPVFDAVENEVNRGTGFQLLDVSTGAPLVDTHPLPASGESDVWTYRGILRDNNVRVGQWSLSVPVPVMGI